MRRHLPVIIGLFALAILSGVLGYTSGFVYQHRAGIVSRMGELAAVVKTSVRVIMPFRQTAQTTTSTVTSTTPLAPPRPVGELKTYTNRVYGISFSYQANFAPIVERDNKGSTGCALRLLFHKKEYVDEAKNILRPEPAEERGAKFSICLTTKEFLSGEAGDWPKTVNDYVRLRQAWLRAEESSMREEPLAGQTAIRFVPPRSSQIGFLVVGAGPNRMLEVYDGYFGYERSFLDIFTSSFKLSS